jgi:hypothetical protein
MHGTTHSEEEMTAMATYERDDEDMSLHSDSFSEERASQEEIYLEEREEEVRRILEQWPKATCIQVVGGSYSK